jgi:hypothetical protein
VHASNIWIFFTGASGSLGLTICRDLIDSGRQVMGTFSVERGHSLRKVKMCNLGVEVSLHLIIQNTNR